jgi:class 3 adenylate cyclase
VTLRLATGGERHVKIERLDWADRAATAHQLSLSPTFRRLFSGQVLRAGLMLKVARVALLFSDLTASTALYRRAGDASAFTLVQDHFELLGAIAQRNGGAIVKTIGDAVMAAFADEADAMRAAIEMQDSFHTFRAGQGDAADVYLKLGLFAGPCYVVTANGVLDYFGMTVNVAARLQATAEPGEIVVPEELAERARVAGWLGTAQVTARFEAELKGLDGPVKAARVMSAFSTGKMRAVPRLKGG